MKRLAAPWVLFFAIATGITGFSLVASAADVGFPAKGKAVSIIVAFPAGGSTDVGARLLAPLIEKEIGTPVQVVNRPGAGGQIGFSETGRSKPDGYLIGYVNIPTIITMYLDPERKATFTRASFQPMAMHVVDPAVIYVKADSPFKTLKDLLDAARAKPNAITMGGDGVMTDDHLVILQLEKLTGTKFAAVQFDGSAPSMNAVLGGHIQSKAGNIGDLGSQFKSGAVRVLAVLDKEENPFLPGVKTAMAQGVNLFSSTGRGLVLPAGTPQHIVTLMTNAVKKAMTDADHKRKMDDSMLTLRYMDPAQFTNYWVDFEEQVKPLMSLGR